MEYFCTICNKKYASYQSKWLHNKKYHSNTPETTEKKTEINYKCELCNITFIDRFSKYRHDKKCNNKINIYTCNKCNKTYTNKNSKYKHQKKCNHNITIDIESNKEKYKSQTIVKKYYNNIGTIISNSNLTNNNSNSNLVINAFGNEDIRYLTDENINYIFDNEIECITTFVELIHFNVNKPENHNFCVSNLTGKYVNKYNNTKKSIDKDRKKYLFDSLISKSLSCIRQIYHVHKFKFTEYKQKQIEETIENLDKLRYSYYNDIVLKEIVNRLNLISYNNREIIINTWNNKDNKNITIKELEQNIINYKLLQINIIDSDSDTDNSSDSDTNILEKWHIKNKIKKI